MVSDEDDYVTKMRHDMVRIYTPLINHGDELIKFMFGVGGYTRRKDVCIEDLP